MQNLNSIERFLFNGNIYLIENNTKENNIQKNNQSNKFNINKAKEGLIIIPETTNYRIFDSYNIRTENVKTFEYYEYKYHLPKQCCSLLLRWN